MPTRTISVSFQHVEITAFFFPRFWHIKCKNTACFTIKEKEVRTMKKGLVTLFLLAVTALWSINTSALEPPPTPNPNGFISGPHYNLNIIGKKSDFVCPISVPGEYG